MRELPEPKPDLGPDGFGVGDPTTRMLDWKDNPATVLEAVDELLAAHGLEIVMFDTGADDYLFKIEKRESA